MARILVVEDQPDVAELLIDSLALDGHHVEAARNGDEALRQLKRSTYDLLISDIQMPGLDGPGLFRALEEEYPHLVPRLVFVSGVTDHQSIQAFLARTRVPVVSKPFEIRALLRVVRAALDRVRPIG
jgi:CheY-like chemotaxis protein